MMNRLKNMLQGDFVVNLLVVAAVVVFVITIIMAVVPMTKVVGAHPVTAILSIIITIGKGLYQPAILLALAKLIEMKRNA